MARSICSAVKTSIRGALEFPITGGGRRVLELRGARLCSTAAMKKSLREIPDDAARPLAWVRSSSGSSMVVRICHKYGILSTIRHSRRVYRKRLVPRQHCQVLLLTQVILAHLSARSTKLALTLSGNSCLKPPSFRRFHRILKRSSGCITRGRLRPNVQRKAKEKGLKDPTNV